MKRILPALVAVALTHSLSAQVSIGNRFGLSISHFESDDSETQANLEKDQQGLMGVSFGLLLETKIKPFIAAQLELGITQKGHQILEKKQVGYHRTRLIYGDGQFLAKGIVGTGPAKLNILGGISFGRGLMGIEREQLSDPDSSLVIQNGDTTLFVDNNNERSLLIDIDQGDLEKTEWALVGGLGASFDLGDRTRLFIDGRYVYGLTSITPAAKDGQTVADVFNRSILIQFGYLVQLNDPKSKVPPKPEAPQY